MKRKEINHLANELLDNDTGLSNADKLKVFKAAVRLLQAEIAEKQTSRQLSLPL